MKNKEINCISISIIIPIYNVEKYLKQCLDTVYNLNLKNKEIILVNDGSTDNSLKIAEGYYEKYKVNTKLITQKNQGLSVARNTGIDNSKGEYLFFLDSDDFIDSENLEKFFYEGMQKKQEILIGNYYNYYLNNKGNKKIELVNYSERLLEIYNKNGDYFIKEGMKGKIFTVAAWRNLYRKDFLERNNLYFEKRLLHEDTLFSLQAFRLAKKVGYSKEKIYYYRQDNPNSIMKTLKEKNYIHMLYIIKKLIEFQKKLGKENRYFNRVLLGIYWQILNKGKLKNNETWDELKKLKYNIREIIKIALLEIFSLKAREIENDKIKLEITSEE